MKDLNRYTENRLERWGEILLIAAVAVCGFVLGGNLIATL